MTTSKRILWLDVARVCAVFSIVSNHAVSRIYDNYGNQMEEFLSSSLLSQIFKAIITTFSWLGVPVFLMITGALILNKKIESKQDLIKFQINNWFPLFTATEFWMLCGYLFLTLYRQGTISSALSNPLKWIIDLVMTLCFTNKIAFGSMWYMDMILLLYLILPIFAVYLNKFKLETIRIPIFILFISGFLVPTINKYLSLFNSDFFVSFKLSYANLFSTYFIWIFAGYYIFKGSLKNLKTAWIVLGLTICGISTVACQLYGYSQPFNLVTGYDSVGIYAISFFLFELFSRVSDNAVPIKNIITYLSKRSFGIYFIHIFVIEALTKNKEIWINRPFMVGFYWLFSIVCSLLVINLMERSNWCKKYLLNMK